VEAAVLPVERGRRRASTALLHHRRDDSPCLSRRQAKLPTSSVSMSTTVLRPVFRILDLQPPEVGLVAVRGPARSRPGSGRRATGAAARRRPVVGGQVPGAGRPPDRSARGRRWCFQASRCGGLLLTISSPSGVKRNSSPRRRERWSSRSRTEVTSRAARGRWAIRNTWVRLPSFHSVQWRREQVIGRCVQRIRSSRFLRPLLVAASFPAHCGVDVAG